MESGDEEEEEVVMVTVGGVRVPMSEVTDDMVARMSFEEKSEYIKLGQEMYHSMYEWQERPWLNEGTKTHYSEYHLYKFFPFIGLVLGNKF